MGLVPWAAERGPRGLPPTHSSHNGAHLVIISSLVSLLCPENRVGRRRGVPNGKHVSSTSSCSFLSAHTPALPLASPSAHAHGQPLLGAATSDPLPSPRLGPEALKDSLSALQKLSPLLTFTPLVLWPLGAPSEAGTGTSRRPCTRHENTGLCCRFSACLCASPFSLLVSFPVCTMGLSPRPCQLWVSHQAAVAGHLQRPISLMERNSTGPSSGLGTEPWSKRGG